MRIIIFLLSITLLFTPLVNAEQTGDIHLYCKPKIRVYLDGDLIGKTNKSDSGILIHDVSLGEHKLRLKKKGKSTEVLNFFLRDSLLDLESEKYLIGRFDEDTRKNKLLLEFEYHSSWTYQLDGNLYTYVKVPTVPEIIRRQSIYDNLTVIRYIPLFDENYAIDSLPIKIFGAIPILPYNDTIKEPEYSNVSIKSLINEKGDVDSVFITIPSGNNEFDSLVFVLALRTKYVPAIKNNKRTSVWLNWSTPYLRAILGKDTHELIIDRGIDLIIEDSIGTKYHIKNSIAINLNENDSLENSSKLIKIDGNIDSYLPGPDEFIPVDIHPEMISSKAPIYPKEEQFKGITGTVLVKVLVSNKGKVLKVLIAKSSGNKQLDNAALDVAPKSKFKPAIQKGKPIALWVSYKVDFKLDN